jgi:hypothetical protein
VPPPDPAAAASRSISRIYKVLAALLGVASSVTALVFTFAPDWVPTGDAPAQSATLSDLRVDTDATFGKYLARIDQPITRYTEQQLRRRGALLDFRVRIEGFRGKTLLLKWELFDKGGTQVNESKAIRITPTNETNEATWQLWVPLPLDEGSYVAFVELIEQKPTHRLKLASLETSELSGVNGGGG